jgi:hypothetical protein
MIPTRLHGDGDDLREELAGLVARTEPPFERGDADAVHAAVRGGRRRVVRTRAAGGLAAVAIVLAVGGVADIAQEPGVREAAPPPPAAAAPAPPKAPPASAPVAATVTRADLLKLLRSVAAPAGGKVTALPAGSSGDGDDVVASAGVQVRTRDGLFMVGANVVTAVPANSASSAARWCRLAGKGGYEDENCVVLTETPTLVVSARKDAVYQVGRERLELVADLTGGRALSVVIDNYVATPPTKTVGPALSAVGLSGDGLIQVVRQSGILTTTGSPR